MTQIVRELIETKLRDINGIISYQERRLEESRNDVAKYVEQLTVLTTQKQELEDALKLGE